MDPTRFRSVLSAERYATFEQGLEEGMRLLEGRVVWNVSSTARGGGVAELLMSLVGYARGAGADVRWVVIEAGSEFFAVTKRIHNRLHGVVGDGEALDDRARAVYERALADNLPALTSRVRPGDVVIVHDPQPAGLIPELCRAGTRVIWRSHIGIDRPDELARAAWAFLLPYVSEAEVFVFSRESFAWEGLDRDRIAVIAPSIDVFSPKNEELSAVTVLEILRATGVVAGAAPGGATFTRHDGTPGRVDRRTQMVESAPIDADTPVVLQVSRWDMLKDPIGVIRGFADHVPATTGAHLIYAGPAVAEVTDDPEGAQVLGSVVGLWEGLPAEQQARVHLASLPLEDPDENATIVNALQRHAAVIVQKSLAEGFGLTVSEAMWKGRPVVASRIGGIETQVQDGETGILLDDPEDLEAYGRAVTELLMDPALARRIGERARERVRDEFSSPRSLLDYLAVLKRLLADPR
jgi:trehalose synthase